ncbi:MAG: hypothetical protein ACMXYG_02945 [Candidatus Woesearchaeota archaeon]
MKCIKVQDDKTNNKSNPEDLLDSLQQSALREFHALERLINASFGRTISRQDIEKYIKDRMNQIQRLEAISQDFERSMFEGIQPETLHENMELYETMGIRIGRIDELAEQYQCRSLREIKRINDEYKKFGKHLRHIIKDEIRTGNYQGLRVPCRKARFGTLDEMELEVNILPRFPLKFERSERNLELGYSEIALCIYGMFVDNNDYTKGIIANEKEKPFRWVIGKPFGRVDQFNNELINSVYDPANRISEYLIKAEYDKFAKAVLGIALESFNLLKDLAHDLELQ